MCLVKLERKSQEFSSFYGIRLIKSVFYGFGGGGGLLKSQIDFGSKGRSGEGSV